jgi:hypothetical protein
MNGRQGKMREDGKKRRLKERKKERKRRNLSTEGTQQQSI